MLRDQLKNFFYRMKVSSPDGSQSAELTNEILRMMTEVVISESSYSDDSQTYPTLTITLNEASWLPEDNSFNTTNPRIRGQFTNRPGSILDLRFDSEKGFTYVSKEEMESGQTRADRTQAGVVQPVIFLFGGNNKIEVEWGLLYPKISRKRTFTITTINMSGGGSGHGKVQITGLDGLHEATKTTLSQGKVFANPTNKQPNTLKQVLFQVALILDYDLEFDGALVTQFPPATSTYVPERTAVGGDTAPPEPNRPIVLTRHMNLHEFIMQLAQDYSSSYEYDTDPKTGRTKLIFKPRNVTYGSVNYTFTYKDPNGVMLEYKLDSVEGQISPASSVSSAGDGELAQETTFAQQVVVKNTGTTEQTTNSSQSSVRSTEQNFTPKIPPAQNTEIVQRINSAIPGLIRVGSSETHPSQSAEALQQKTSRNYESGKYVTMLSMTTLGDPRYRPGLAKVNNIGLRYSTFYRMFTVQHNLRTSGYTCTFNGKSQFLGGEAGIDAGEAAKSNTQEKVQLLKK